MGLNKIPLRAYCINNMYLGGIHAGIQSAHSIARLVSQQESKQFIAVPDYGGWTTGDDLINDNYTRYQFVREWVNNHETIIILNGGNALNMNYMLNLASMFTYPYAEFYETEIGDEPVLTNITIIMPDVKQLMRSTPPHKMNEGVWSLIENVSNLRLMK